MPAVAVTKMHGAYNDFVIMDRRRERLDDPEDFARRVCDRRGGVGADGFIAIGGRNGKPSMEIFNPDGSRAEVCGNGLCCVARFLSEAGEGDRFEIATDAGPVQAAVVEKGETYRVRIAFAKPAFERRALPFANAAFVSMGNPHVVIFERSIDAIDLQSAARELAPLFPNGTNVHVAAPLSEHLLEVRHYERGVGWTYACGSGAAACAAAAISRGLASSPVTVRVPGGELVVAWDGANEVELTGPAVRVFEARLSEMHAAP